MGESANLAFYAVVFAKGNVPKAKLDEALNRAVTTGAPLEAALVQSGALGRADCDGLLKIRDQLGRVCQSCQGTTYLLQDQTEANTPCEYCGGRLLTREQQRARDAAKAPPPTAARPEATRRPPPPLAKRASETMPAVSRRAGAGPRLEPPPAQLTPRRQPPASASLEPRLAQLEHQLGALARELIEERQARVQMGLLLNEASARAARVDELAAAVKATTEELAATRGDDTDPAERALVTLQERLGVDDVSLLPGRIAEQVAPRVLQAVRDRLGLDELSDLPARIAAEVEAQAGKAAPAPAASVDEEAIARRVAEQVRASAPAAPAVDVDARVARAVDEAARRALDAVEARLATVAAPAAPDPREEAALVERVLEAVAARLPATDPAALEERVTRRALDALGERLDRQPDPRELVDAGLQRVVSDAAARAVEAARALIDEARERDDGARERDDEARASAAEGIAALSARVDALATAAERTGADDLAGEVARAVEGSLLARVEERLAASAADLTSAVGEAEGRIARATGEVLEALSARIEELAAAPRGDAPPAAAVEEVARGVAERVVKDAIERLDDPRELIQRATAQATRGLDDRVASLRAELTEAAKAAAAEAARTAAERAAAASGPAASAQPEALTALEGRVALIAAELKDALETLDARIAALRERTSRTKEPRDDEALVARAVAAAEAAVEERLAAAPARPAEGEPAGSGAEAALVQKAVQAVWDQLAPLDLPGLPARVSEQVLAAVTKKLDGDMAGLVDTIAQEATAPVLRSIEARLEKLDLKGLPDRLTREVSAQVRASLGDDEALTEALVERVAARVAAGRDGGGRERRVDDTPLAPELEQLVDRAAARALEWVEDRLTALERGGGIELEMARAAARAVATEVVEKRLAEQPATPQPGDFDGNKTIVADAPKSGVFDPRTGEPKSGVFDKKFIALAREVKNLKDIVEELQAGGAGARPPGGASPELVTLLASAEFKQAFDAKVKEVLNYIKGDLIPSAVKRAMQAEGSA